MTTDAPDSPASGRRVPARSRVVLLAIVAAFLLVRVPVMLRAPGAQDEDFFAVPGWTVATEGAPRIPYLPSRDPQSVFYHADELLFALPPAGFYVQAPFHLVFGPGYGSARLASAAAGVVAVLLVYLLGRALYQNETTALWAAGLYSVSRLFYFSAIFARPDMLCATVGLAALWVMLLWRRTQRRRLVALSGALVGLGLLTHPFALVFAIQIGVWVLAASKGRERLLNAGLFGLCAAAVLACWLPLIAVNPQIFEAQFANNVLNQAGPGLLHRFVMPFDSIAAHFDLLMQRAGPVQLSLVAGGLLGATWADLRGRQPGPRIALALAWSGAYLLVVCQGTHPAQGYWCYPAALLFLCVARSAVLLYGWFDASLAGRRWAAWIGGMLLVAIMIPGSGVRTTLAHFRNWSDPAYDRRTFVRTMLAGLPQDARFVVGPEYVFDVYLSGRPTVLGLCYPFFFDSTGVPYDSLIVGRSGLEQNVPAEMRGRFVRSYGRRDDLFACYAELYRPPEAAEPQAAEETR